MELAVGQVLEGTVTGITKFGAFVSLEGGKSGLVHISEIANTFVNDVHDHVQIGQKVKVKVLSLGDAGKINLSIKRAAEAPRQNPPARRPNPSGYQSAPRPAQQSTPAQGQVAAPTGNQEFEDRLKRFMQESDSRIADNRMYSERKQRSRRR